MAIESYGVEWDKGDESRDVPGLVSGVYVDQDLRDPRNDTDVPTNVAHWDGNDVFETASDEVVAEDDPLAAEAFADFKADSGIDENLQLLGYGPSLSDVVAKVIDNVSGEFGNDEDMIALEKALKNPSGFDLDGVHASEMALSGTTSSVRENFFPTRISRFQASKQSTHIPKTVRTYADLEVREQKRAKPKPLSLEEVLARRSAKSSLNAEA